MKKIISIIHKLEDILLVAVLVYIVVMVLLGVVLRYFFHYSILGSDEIIGYLVVFLGMMGSAATIRDDSNICLDALVSKIPKEKQRYLYGPIQAAIVVILIFYIYCSWNLTKSQADVLAPMTRISMAYPYGAMTVSLCFMVFEQVVMLVKKIRDKTLFWPQSDYENQ